MNDSSPTISGAMEGEPEDPTGSVHVDRLLYDEESVCGTPHMLSPVSERREESSSVYSISNNHFTSR